MAHNQGGAKLLFRINHDGVEAVNQITVAFTAKKSAYIEGFQNTRASTLQSYARLTSYRTAPPSAV